MKKIQELVFRTTDNTEHNILFANRRKAEMYLKKHYYVGAFYTDTNGSITCSTIVERVLF